MAGLLLLGGTRSAPVQAQTITKVQPQSGTVGTPVHIHGDGFSSTSSDNTVEFGGTVATVDSAKSTVLYVTVPSGPSGPVDVTVSNSSGTTTAQTAFSVVTGGAASFANTRAGLGGTQLGSVEWADFNNDGRFDLLVTGADTNSAPSATVYLADGSGGYAPADAGLTGVQRSASAVGDVDGDGVLDIVLTGEDENFNTTTTVYLGDGSGGFSSANAGLPGVLDGSVSIGDLNEDGVLDLVLTGRNDSGNGTATAYLGDGTGNFTSADAGLTGVQEGSSSSLGDVDGDGHLDLLVTGDSTGTGEQSSVLYLGEGAEGFSVADAGLAGFESGSSAMGDVNGDGFLDLVLTGSDVNFEQKTIVYLNDGSGGFSTAGAGVPGTETGSVSLGDVDGNGTLDLLLTGENNGSPTSTLYLGEVGTGQFTESPAVLGDVEQSDAVLADAGGDGDLDLALAGLTALNSTPIVRVYQNEAISAATSLGVSALRPRFGAPGTTMRIEGSGFTSSTTVTFGGIQANVTNATSTSLTVTVPTDASGPVPVTVEESGASVTAADRFTVVSGGSGTLAGLGADLETVDNASAAWGDFDEDGRLDLLVTASGASGLGKTTVYLGDGAGGFTKANAGLLGVDFSASDVGDVNGDGHLDVVLAGEGGGSGSITLVYLGDGTGGFTRAEAGLRGLDQGSANFGDLNGDGHLDLVVTGDDGNGDPHTDVYLGYGDGQFTRAEAGLPGLDQSASALGDLDGDGTLDLVIAGEDINSTKQTKVYLGDGTGDFNDANASLTNVANGSVELGDVDDGPLDLVLSGYDTNNNRITTVYLGDGTGQFSLSEASLPGAGDSSSDLGDVNGDGILDLVISGALVGSNGPETALFIGDGTGNFSRAGLGMLGVRRGASELGDLDGDGDLDLAVVGGGSSGGSYVYENEAISAAAGVGVSNVRPRTGTAGAASARIEGSGFTSSTTVTFGGNAATVTNARSTALTANVPSGVRGPVPVSVDESGTSVTAADRFVAVEDDSASFSGVETNLEGVSFSSSEWADFNEDGVLDLLLTGDGSATVYLGGGTGFFTKAGAGLTGVDRSATDVGDVNGDGHLDLVISGSGNTTVYLGNGTGGFSEAPALLPGLRAGSATLGDINNDGHPDLVLTGTKDDNLTFADPFVKVYLGYGDGRFAGTKTDLTPVFDSTTNLADLDDDGNLDLVATGDSSGASTSIYLGDGTGGFARQGLGLTGVTDGSSNIGDFDNDGNLDLLITGRDGSGNESATVYFGDGTGGFSPVGASLTPVERSASDVGDVNGDGDLDLTLTGFDSNSDRVSKVYLGDGGGGFTEVGAGLAGLSDGSSDFGDLDGDGELDLVITGFDSGPDEAVFLYENGPPPSPPLRVTGLQPTSAAPGESVRIYGTAFDTTNVSNNTVSFGDTQAPASSATSTSLTVTVPSGVTGPVDLTVTTPDSSVTAAERFTAVTGGSTTYAPLGNLTDVAESSSNWGDFNEDGTLDLFVSGDSSSGETATLYLGNGTGGFTEAGAELTGVERSASEVGDLNNDGHLDLVVSGDVGGSFSTTVYLGNGSGSFSTANTGLGGMTNGSIALGDFDGDGILDLVLTEGEDSGLLLGDGTGKFLSADAGLPSFSGASTAVGDVNDDGHLDLFVAGYNSGPQATLYLGDGDGGLTAAGAGVNGVEDGTTDFGDVNSDGNLDLLVTGDSTGSGDPSAVLYLGDDTGGFNVANAGVAGLVNSAAEIGDLDGDGNRDILVAGDSTGSDDPATMLYLGDGTGNFTVADAGFAPARNGSSALGDLDGDGDLDPVLTGQTASSDNSRSTTVYQSESIAAATGLAVTKMRPHTGPPGTTVRIEGAGFSSTASDNTVTFGSTGATVSRASTTALTVTVPTGESGSVPVSVSTSNGTATAANSFSVVTGGQAAFTELDAGLKGTENSSAEWADFDNDGNLDLLVTGRDTSGGSTTTLYLGDGIGGFTEANADLMDVSFGATDVGDVNGDGNLDLILVDGAGSARIYLGDGTGAFTTARAKLLSRRNGPSAEFGDVNDDGNLDLVLAGERGGNPTASVYLGYGDGRFTRTDAGLAGVDVSSSDFGDVNNDGDLDLVLTGFDETGTASTTVYLGDGGGGFSVAGASLSGVADGSSDFGDVDGDGNLDLLVTGNFSATLYLGDGGGGFNAADAGLNDISRSSSDIGDVNGDGNPDLVLTGEASSEANTWIYFGDGSGGFTQADVSSNLMGVLDGSSEFADLFGDGTLDLYVSGTDDDFDGVPVAALYRNGSGVLPIAPASPTGLTASSTSSEVSLNWTASDSADVIRYRIYRRTTPIDSTAGPSSFTPLDSTDASTTSFTDGTISSFPSYYYRVTAVDDDTLESAFSNEVHAKPSTELRITTVQPQRGIPGATVRIRGSNFATTAADNTVSFGSASATVTSATSTTLTVEVPGGVSGAVPVTVGTPEGSLKTSPRRFTVVTGGSGTFTDGGADLLPTTESASVWGDFNEDGNPDLVVAGADSNGTATTTLYFGDGAGGFSAANAGLRDVSVNSGNGDAGAAGDLNADGHLDLVLSGEQDFDDSTSVYLGDGTGQFSSQENFPGFTSLEMGDVNEDGNLDLLNVNFDGATVYYGDGTGGFTPGTPIDLNKSIVSSSALGDVNEDGHLDFVVAGENGSTGTPELTLHLGDGTGGFTRASANLTGIYFGAAEFGDVNADGHLDLVVTGSDVNINPMTHVYLGDGTGDLSRANADVEGSYNGDLAVADVNGDGADDLVTAGQDTSFKAATNLYVSNGTGGFTRASADLTDVSLSNTSVGDFESNGTLDLFVAGLDTNTTATATLYQNEVGQRTPPDPPTDLTASAAEGRVDLSWTASDSADVSGYRVYRDTAPIDSAAGPSGRTPLGTTDASTTSFVDSSVTGGTTYYYRATAVDDEGTESGFSDESQATPTVPLRITQLQPTNGAPGTPVRIYGAGFSLEASNNSVTLGGTSAPIDSAKTNVIYAQVPSGVSGLVSVSVTADGGSVTAPSRFTVASGGGAEFSALGADLAGVDLGGADWGDYNGDGTPDLVVTGVDSNGTETARIYRNDGNGDVTVLDADLTGVNGPAEWGDYNGDGALDLVVVGADTSGAYTATIYRNEGNDTFTAIDAGLIGVASSSVAWGDYNGDGTLDLAVIGLDESDTRSARVYRNDGNGSFTAIEAGLTGVRSGDVAWGDYNGDGALDLAIIGTDTNDLKSTTIYRNDGNDAFTDIGASLTGVNLGSVAWGDYNGDGRLDLVLTGEDSDFIRHTTIYQNNGDGTFGSVEAGLTGVTFGDVAWGDYDADGALDLAVIGDSTGTVQAGGGTATLYQNDGSGAFSRVGAGLRGVEGGSVGWNDATQDGAVDLVVTGLDNDSNKTATIYRNGAATTAPPTAREDSARLRRGASRIVAVLANDEAEAGLDSASVTVESEPNHGSTTVSDTGSVVYTHDGSDNFSDSFTYTVADTEGQRSEAAPVLIDAFGVDVQAEASLAEGATIGLIAKGNFEPSGGTLFARIGGTTSYQEIGLTETDTDPLQFTATIPDSLVTTRGIDYYAVLSGADETATVPAGGEDAAQRRPAHIPVQFDELEVPVSVQPETYRMMTVSALPTGGIKAALEQNYGDYDPAEWRVLRWDPSQGSDGEYREYPSIDSLRPGEGFWLITSDGSELSLGSGQTAEASVARKVPLKSGWNQLGSPFTYAVRWDSIRTASGLSASEIDGPVAFSDSAYRYGQTSLTPWEGAFVRASNPDTLVVPPVSASSQKDRKDGEVQSEGPVALRGSGSIGTPATGARTTGAPAAEESSRGQVRADGSGHRPREASGKKVRPTDPGLEAPAQASSAGSVASKEASTATAKYTLRVGAWPTGSQPHRVWVGLRPKAKAGRDALDFAQAPPIARTVRLAVLETIEDESVPHAGSFKPPSEEGRTWELDLSNRSGHAQETRLRLRSQGSIPSGQNRYVMDLDAERRVAPGAKFNLESGEERRLKVIVGTEAFAKAESEGIELNTFKNELRGNYPNPFGQETTIAYSLESEREVTIEIYDVLGRRVQTLVRGKRQEAGLHRVRWRVGRRSGASAGSGVYFYRIEAGSFTETRKMVLVR